MKKLIFVIFLLVTTKAFTQYGWFVSSTFNSAGNYEVLKSVKFYNEKIGFAVGPYRIYKTTDTGSNWTRIQNYSPEAICITYTDSLTWYVSERGIYKTTNMGLDWTFQIYSPNLLYSIHFVNDNTGFAAGGSSGSNYLLKTTNKGVNWNEIQLSPSYELNTINFIDAQTGFVAGRRGAFFKTTNGGLNWYGQSPDTLYDYFTMFVTQNNIIYVSAGYISQGRVVKSTDNGNTWVSLLVGSGDVNSLYFTDDLTGYAVDNGRHIYKTSNGGVNWSSKYFSQISELNDIYFINENTGVAVGGQQFAPYAYVILKTTNAGELIGVNPVSNQIPESWNLTQNYPNPFNPVTKIKFALPKQSFAKIVIYDHLGREVTTLVNEQLKPGTYEVDWDGTGFASGVYFYSLVTNDFIETKRMVLIK